MAGLDNIKGYDEGGDVESTTATTGGLAVKVGPKGNLVPAAKELVADPAATADLLKNMESMIAERADPWRNFQRSLERASAWAVPSLDGQKAQALNATNAAQNKEDQDLFAMRQQLAGLKAAQSSAANDAARLAALTPGGAGGVGSAGGVPAIPADVQARMDSARTAADKLAIRDEWLKGRVTESTKKEFSPAMAGMVDAFNSATGQFEQMTLAQFEQMRNQAPNVYRSAKPSNAQPIQQTGGVGGINASNIRQVESGGNPNAVSPKGAVGVMQTMPNTLRDPGFGVAPAKDNSPAELQRVGEDYYKAMQGKYGHDTLAAVAYNMGPGATDAWIQKGAKFGDLPAETRDYIGKVNLANAMQTRQAGATAQPQTGVAGLEPAKATTAAAPLVSAVPTRSEYEVKQKSKLAGSEELAKEQSKLWAPEIAAIQEKALSAGQLDVTLQKQLDILKDPDMKNVLSKFQTGSFGDALIRQIDEGIQAGNFGGIGVRDLVKNATKVGASPAQIEKLEMLDNALQQAQVLYSKNIKGQGSVSDAERKLISTAVGKVTDPAGKLRILAESAQVRTIADKELETARKLYMKSGGDFGEFKSSDEYKAVEDRHNERLAKVLGVDISKTAGNKLFGLEPAKGGETKVEKKKPTWKVIPG